MLSLLRRIVEALEVQADYYREARDAYRAREARDATDRAVAEQRRAENDAFAERQQATLARAVEQQRQMLEAYQRHIVDCERWHKVAAGINPEELLN